MKKIYLHRILCQPLIPNRESTDDYIVSVEIVIRNNNPEMNFWPVIEKIDKFFDQDLQHEHYKMEGYIREEHTLTTGNVESVIIKGAVN